jgi:hydroxyacylglutathione hydrolase
MHEAGYSARPALAAIAVLQLLPVPAFDDNYLWLAADGAGNAIAVDPGDAAPVRAALRRTGWHLRAILVTHHHPDHIGGVAELADAWQAPVFAPHEERIPLNATRVAEGHAITLDLPGETFSVMEVPGHTLSHIAYSAPGMLFCGDTLFSVGCGRLFEGTPEQMLASLDRIAALPASTIVCCAHEYTAGNCAFALSVEPRNAALHVRTAEVRERRTRGEPTLPTDIASERACNPFLRVDAPAVVAWAQHTHGVERENRVARFAALRRAKDEFKVPASW